MAIKTGDPVPALSLKRLTDDGMEDVDTGALFGSGTHVLFSVPGAFTPTCSAKHLPGFIQHAAAFAEKGVASITCTAVNDPFVMKVWGEQSGAADKVAMLPDGNGAFVTALGLELDASGFGLGKRGQRFAMIIKDGKVADLQIDEGGAFEKSSAEYILGRL